jgi:hypothetical protein
VTDGKLTTGVSAGIRAALAVVLLYGGCASTKKDTGILDVTWTVPTTNADGSPLTNIASYNVFYGTEDLPCPVGHFRTVAASGARPTPGQTVSVRLTGLTPGRLYYVSVAAVNADGSRSDCSATVSARARSLP